MLLKTGREVYPDAAKQYREVPFFAQKEKSDETNGVRYFFSLNLPTW